MVENADNCCEMCGQSFKSDARLRQIHHIDYNKRNNDINNLELLCFWCHWQEHDFKVSMLLWALMKGKITLR